MARHLNTLPVFTREREFELEWAFHDHHCDRDLRRLQTMQLVADCRGESTAREIAELAGVSRATLFRWMKLFQEGGCRALLRNNYRCSHEVLHIREMLDERHSRWIMRAKNRAEYERTCSHVTESPFPGLVMDWGPEP
jgi:hypothetical protein